MAQPLLLMPGAARVSTADARLASSTSSDSHLFLREMHSPSSWRMRSSLFSALASVSASLLMSVKVWWASNDRPTDHTNSSPRSSQPDCVACFSSNSAIGSISGMNGARPGSTKAAADSCWSNKKARRRRARRWSSPACHRAMERHMFRNDGLLAAYDSSRWDMGSAVLSTTK